MQRLLNLQRSRMEQQNPLYESVLQSTFNRLPTTATAGLSLPSLASAQAAVPPVETAGNYSESQQLRDLLRQGEIRQRMGEPLWQAINALAQSRLSRGGR